MLFFHSKLLELTEECELLQRKAPLQCFVSSAHLAKKKHSISFPSNSFCCFSLNCWAEAIQVRFSFRPFRVCACWAFVGSNVIFTKWNGKRQYVSALSNDKVYLTWGLSDVFMYIISQMWSMQCTRSPPVSASDRPHILANFSSPLFNHTYIWMRNSVHGGIKNDMEWSSNDVSKWNQQWMRLKYSNLIRSRTWIVFLCFTFYGI